MLPGDLYQSLPASPDAEKGVLCSMLLHGDALAYARDRLTPRHFHEPAHRIVYSAIVGLAANRAPIDPITVNQALYDSGSIADVGGPAIVPELYTFTHTSANVDYFAEILHQKLVLRDLLEASTRIRNAVGPNDPEAALSVAESAIKEVRALHAGSQPQATLARQMVEALDEIERAIENPDSVGLKTGLIGLDAVTGGLRNGEVSIVAARPSGGKTALALTAAANLALDAEKQTVFFSMEMTAPSLLHRLISMRAGVPLGAIRSGRLAVSDLQRINHAANTIKGKPLHVDASPRLGLLDLLGRIRQRHIAGQCDVVLIDYVQLIKPPPGNRYQNRTLELGEISASIKALAVELNIPIVLLAQLGRASEQHDGPPRLSHLRESGNLEQDADVIIMLQRDADDAGSDDASSLIKCFVAKNRNGATTGEDGINLLFRKPFTKFEDFTL